MCVRRWVGVGVGTQDEGTLVIGRVCFVIKHVDDAGVKGESTQKSNVRLIGVHVKIKEPILNNKKRGVKRERLHA